MYTQATFQHREISKGIYNGIWDELRLSPRWIAVILVFWGLGFVYISDWHGNAAVRTAVLLFALLLFIGAGVVWVFGNRQADWPDQIARWSAVLLLCVAVVFSLQWPGYPILWGITPIPVAFTLLVLGTSAGALVGGLETVTLIALVVFVPDMEQGGGEAQFASAGAAILSIWTLILTVFAARLPLTGLLGWMWTHYQESQRLLGAARERNVEMDRVLDELLHANRQLDLMNERLAAMRAHAEEAQRAKAVFMAKVSHELRTPLNMIIGLTDLLVETPTLYGSRLPSPLLEDLKIVHRNCEHLSGMIKDVLDLSQTEVGHLTLHKTAVPLLEEVQNAAEVVRPLFEKKRLALRLDLPAELPEIICDRTRIRQVILNLLSNAARYTSAGSVTVAVEEQSHRVIVRVIDTGPGIAVEDVKHIFEPFYQTATATGRSQDGVGLGLSICKQFVELHNGQLWLESTVGEGTTFFFSLPISDFPPPIVQSARWLTEGWQWFERDTSISVPVLPRHPRVMVCDEIGQFAAYPDSVVDHVEWIQSDTLDTALEALAQYPAHLLLVNAATEEDLPPLLHRACRNAPDTPVVGCVFPAQVAHILQAGAMDYLIKPVIRADLVDTLQAFEPPIRRILLVDDDPDFRRLLARMVQTYDESLEIRTAADGQAGLDLLREMVRQNGAPDLMLLDLMLPRLMGWQVLAQKEEDPAIQAVPVVILSSQDPSDQPQRSPVLMAGMGNGFSLDKLLHCSLELSRLLLSPSTEPEQS